MTIDDPCYHPQRYWRRRESGPGKYCTVCEIQRLQSRSLELRTELATCRQLLRELCRAWEDAPHSPEPDFQKRQVWICQTFYDEMLAATEGR